MADKKTVKAPEKILEREYVIPLRREFIKTPYYKKQKKSITAIKEFISKHMKDEEVKIGPYLNELIWSRGPRNPIPRVKVKTRKMENYTQVELIDKPYQETKEEKEVKTTKKEEKKKDKTKEMTQEKEDKLVREDKAEEVLEKESGKPLKIEEEKHISEQVEEKLRSQKIVTQQQKAHRSMKS